MSPCALTLANKNAHQIINRKVNCVVVHHNSRILMERKFQMLVVRLLKSGGLPRAELKNWVHINVVMSFWK